MPRFEIEIDDKGTFVGQAPAELEALFKATEAAAHGRGYSKGMSEAAEAAKKQIEDNVRAELAKREALAPLEKEKFERTAEENTNLKKQILEVSGQGDRALKAREEQHARELLDRAERLKKADGRIRALVKAGIRAEAIAAGARDESLAELEVILGAAIGYTDELEPFVKDEQGEPMTQHGKPVSIATYVKGYLETHPHHRRPAPGAGGNARGGRSLSGTAGDVAMTAETAKARIAAGDRSAEAINDLFEATRRPRA
jgi:hypothetical protein